MNPDDATVLAVALATIRRLNRRCQTAEAALNMRVEQWQQRSKVGLRNHYFDRGREYERCRMFAPPTALQRAADIVVALVGAEDGVRFDPETSTWVARHTILTAGTTEQQAHEALAEAVRLTADHWPPRPVDRE